MSSQSILVVDDDPRICDMLREYLGLNGFEVRTAEDGDEMRRRLAEQSADLLILDLMLPGEDGLSLTRYIRQHTEMPIIILTGRGEEVDTVVGLEMGADDYIAKPFSLRELLARVKTVMRRARSNDIPSGDTRSLVKFGSFEFDRMARRLINDAGEDVPLTTGEFNLLRAFTDHPNRILDRDRLSELTNNRKWSPDDRSVDVLVGRLRAKIEKDPGNPELIKTVRGSGYILAAEIQTSDTRSIGHEAKTIEN